MNMGSMYKFVAMTAVVAVQTATVGAAQWADQMVTQKNIDFGVIATGSEARKLVQVTNLNNEPVTISNVRTTCGCSAATPGKSLLQSGESTMVEVEMNTKKFRQRKDSNLIIEMQKRDQFGTVEFSEVRIPITAYIRSDVVIQPGSLQLGNLEYGQGGTATVSIAYAGRADWNIKDIRINNKDLVADLIPTRREGGIVNYTLNMKLRPTAEIGRLRQLITLVTDDANNPFVPLMVEGNVEPDITITPSTVNIPRVGMGQTTQIKVVVKGKKPFQIEDVDCEKMGDCFTAEFSSRKLPVHVVPIKFNAPSQPGQFQEEMIVKIAGRTEPLRFRVTGLIN